MNTIELSKNFSLNIMPVKADAMIYGGEFIASGFTFTRVVLVNLLPFLFFLLRLEL